ncbi:TetR/AcrR family transcriptional regulator [Nocardioides alkalitolerans]|uniref:TetR/AcrR family transcriptional regulator n=1 Tax=Nocardioides alkalitolerans TaxID=281714 RepID=UPI00069423F7|nr:TetR/AcrR family transcriptional regulator [Nocardioides alkalitolerans]
MSGTTRSAGRPRRAGVTRSVLDAAVDLVGRQGYRATSLDEIARAAGVAKTTVYRRWDSKGALVADALLDRLGDLPGVTGETDLRSTVAWLARSASAPDVHALLLGVMAESSDGDLRTELRERVRGPFVAALGDGWRVDHASAATAFDLVVGTLLFRSTGADPVDDRLVDDVTDLVVGYLNGSRAT